MSKPITLLTEHDEYVAYGTDNSQRACISASTR